MDECDVTVVGFPPSMSSMKIKIFVGKVIGNGIIEKVERNQHGKVVITFNNISGLRKFFEANLTDVPFGNENYTLSYVPRETCDDRGAENQVNPYSNAEKDQQQDGDKWRKNLYVRNIPSHLRSYQAFRHHFQRFGDLEECTLPDTKQFGFLKYNDHDDALWVKNHSQKDKGSDSMVILWAKNEVPETVTPALERKAAWQNPNQTTRTYHTDRRGPNYRRNDQQEYQPVSPPYNAGLTGAVNAREQYVLGLQGRDNSPSKQQNLPSHEKRTVPNPSILLHGSNASTGNSSSNTKNPSGQSSNSRKGSCASRNIEDEKSLYEVTHFWTDLKKMPVEGGMKCILAQRFDPSTHAQAVKMHFESKKRSGGGPVESVIRMIDGLLITFKNEDDCETCASTRNQEMNEARLKIFTKIVPTYHNRKFVIKGVGEGTSEYVLKMFLERCTKEEITPTLCKKQTIPGVYLVEYSEHEFVDVDTDEFLAKVSADTLEEHRLQGSRLLRTDCLLVSGVVSNASDDEIQFVLESKKRTDGGPVTRIDHVKNGNVLVYFADFKDAERIYNRFKKPCKEVIVIAGSPVSVELYYHSLSKAHEDIIERKVAEPKQKVKEELLGDILNSSEGRAILLKTNCDEKIFDLIKGSKIHLGALKDKFKDMAYVELQRTGLDGCVVKFVPKTSRVGYDQKCRKFFNDFVSNFATECKTFDKEKLAKAKSLKLHPLLDSDTDKNKVSDVMIKWNQELGSVEVTGLKNRIEAILQEIENSVEADTVTLPVDEDGYRVMVHCGIIGELSHKHSKIKISCDDEKSQIFITGPDRDISQIQIEALSLMNMAKERKITNLDECAVKYLLQNADRSQMMIQSAISRSNIKARFGFDSDELYIKARNSGEHKKAMNIIRDMVALEILPVMGTKADVVKSDAWKQFEQQQAKSGNLGLYLKPDNSIVMVGMQADVRVLKTRVDTFLDANEIKRDYIQMEYGYAKFVLERSQEFSALNPVRKAVKCGLTPEQGGGLFTEGIKTDRDSARRAINGLVLKVVHKRHTLRDPGIKSYYVGSEGKEFLETTGRVNNCIILLHSPTCEEWLRYAKEHQNTAVLSGGNASAVESSSKNLITVDRSGVHLAVWKTDIIQHRCDVIVNASNKELALLSGGVSGVIKQYDMKNANQIQSEMNAISSQNFGTLMPGEAAITSAGNLPNCKKIVHAVGPRWTNKSERDNKPGLILKSSIRKSLEETEKAKLSSIAIPAISCGVFGGDIKVCVPLILNAVNDYFNDNKASCIKQVDFVELANSAVLDEFKKGVSKMGTRVQTKSANQPQQQNTQASAALLPNFVKLTQGDIAQENVDVIVNIMAEGHVQDISQGSAVSKAIAAVGGQAVLNECAQHRGKYGAGSVFKTSAGSLTCQEVYHGLVRNFDKSSENTVKRLVKKCLDMAESSRMQSIAFPAIGTGGFRFPPQDVAKWMKDALGRFKFNYVTSVLIVLHSSNPAAINAFQVEFTGSVNTPQNIPAPASNTPLPQSAVHGPLTVSVIQGDLTKQSCDAIVNSTNSGFNLSQGLVSTKILEEGGDDIQDEIDDAKGDFAVTSGGKLPCKNIIHMVTPTGKEDLQKKIVNLLQLADAKGFSSVAIPALGTGKLSMDSSTVGLMMRAAIEAFVKLNPRTSTLNIVHIVIFDPKMLRHFQEAILSDQAAHKTILQKLVDGVKSWFSFSGMSANDQQVETLDLYLYAGSMLDINQTLRCIENETKKMMHRETIEDAALDRLTAMENFEIEQIEKKNDVKIEYKSGKYLKHLILIGLTKNVMKACDAIRNVLRELSEAETFVQYIAWEKLASNGVWVELPARAAHGLEKAYQEKKNGILTEVQVWEFQFNKIAPQTYDLSTLGADPSGPNPPKIRRKPKEQGAQQADVFPSDWEDMKGTLLKRVRINTGSAEYQKVTTSFQNTGLRPNNVIIDRIQSVTLYKQYAAKKAEVTKKLQGTNPQIERQLFHGTTNADKIISNGFDRSFAGANAAMYGNGVYFATNAGYSHGYTRPGANGMRTIFLADVITGAFTQGSGGLKTPPTRSGIDLYDSVVDNINGPTMYVIFKDASAYPTYLIQYQ